ncbi:class F sortase [Streptomyces sp. NPDC057403]|uniref:class F sortase n=1 Tax=Streptomyces sp. NPDC057403 TaxID=3346119 RepID=UPI0036868C9A
MAGRNSRTPGPGARRPSAHRGRARRPRPWYRTRAYRLSRTLVLGFLLVVGAVRCSQDDGPPTTTAAPEPAPARSQSPAPRADDARPAPPRTVPRRTAPPPRPLSRSRATRVVIPYIGVDAPVFGLGLDRDHRLTAPPEDDGHRVGWYEGGPSPGEQGTAVVVGHLDTRTGPAVFAGLGELGPGHLVELRRADGHSAFYTVDKVRTYEKAHFPNGEVYGARGRPELRLITCGGAYDRRTGYAGNTVVFAHLTRTR